MKAIAKFEKVSKNQFVGANENCTEDAYNAIILPVRATVGSAGYDFFAPYDFTLKPDETITVPTGIRAKIENGYLLSVYPRSGLGFKYRLQLNNTVGIIDSDYYYSSNEGHIFIRITNRSLDNKTVEIKKGSAFAQGIFTQFFITYDDNVTGTRDGGMGSTDKNRLKQ